MWLTAILKKPSSVYIISSTVHIVSINKLGLRKYSIAITTSRRKDLENFNLQSQHHKSHQSYRTKETLRTTTKNYHKFYSRFSANNIMSGSAAAPFRVSDYDCIGFDLDNTLLQYKLSAMVKLEYEVLAKYLVGHKGYSGERLLKPIEEDIDFLQKGLIIDFNGGNLLKITPEGYILKVAHGTRFLDDAEIRQLYGADRMWHITNEFTKDLMAAWTGVPADHMRTLLDYFDMPSALIFARIVDTLDEAAVKLDVYNIWSDILDGLIHMYTREHFEKDISGYFSAIKQNPDKYIYQSSAKVVEFLRNLKEKKTTFLITGSNIDLANFTGAQALGADWKDLFDIVICFAKKPGFFYASRPFVKLDGITETTPLKTDELELNQTYTQGNWEDLLSVLAKKRSQSANDMKVLYFGDNLIQDVFAPTKFTKCDSVAISEEMLAEGLHEHGDLQHPDEQLLKSTAWGSYFGNVNEPTIWSQVIRQHSKICIPNIDVLAANSIDFEYNSFSNSPFCLNGYYPKEPAHLKP